MDWPKGEAGVVAPDDLGVAVVGAVGDVRLLQDHADHPRPEDREQVPGEQDDQRASQLTGPMPEGRSWVRTGAAGVEMS